MTLPQHIPLPPSPGSPAWSRPVSPQTVPRPRVGRTSTEVTVRASDPFHEPATIHVNQPVGSLSISSSSRDVCLASRKGLYILDLENLDSAPRFIPQGGTWQIADCQWSPHPATSNYILSTSSQKLLVWDLNSPKALHMSIDAHARAITDINWHAINPNLIATVAMDAGIRGWDLRVGDHPFMRLCAWGAAGTQVKWNRQHEHILATAHGKEVNIWDVRNGSVPMTTIKAHDAKIYGIDWDRRRQDRIVTCSLDKTIKFWDTTSLTTISTISTTYPVWRARNLPFGHGVLALPQRGETALEMFSTNTNLVERFEGHDDVVKEFVWRVRGGSDSSFDDREFQLVTWGKDRTLRIWPVAREVAEEVGFQYGRPIDVLFSRRGAANLTYTDAPGQKAALPTKVAKARVEKGMTRGGGIGGGAGGGSGGSGGKAAMDQLEWLTKFVRNRAADSAGPSRSRSRARGESADEFMSLRDEIVHVHKLYPKPKINFEKVDLVHRKLSMTLNGPWAHGDRLAFIRIHWAFPANYPHSPATFELERNATVSPATRFKLVSTIKEMRSANKQCLAAVSGFLLGYQERPGRRLIESDDENESMPMLERTCGATFGPNGQLVCFFPKQTVLPRARGSLSRSPSVTRDAAHNPYFKAITALSRLENPRKLPIRLNRRQLRRPEPPQPVQAGSTVTIHPVPGAGPDAYLARFYTTSLENNFFHALEANRHDHAAIFAALRGILSESGPSHAAVPHSIDPRRERLSWERSLERKRQVLGKIFLDLIASHDVQILAIISCVLLEHQQAVPLPPKSETAVRHSPEQDYFTLPRIETLTPRRSSLTTPASPGPSSYRTSGWSQILMNPSSISLRGMALTPKDRASFDFARTPGSLDESPTLALSQERPRDIRVLSSSPQTMSTPSIKMPSASPLRRNFSRPEHIRRRRVQACSVKIEMLSDDSSPSLLDPEMLPSCELWKLAYADFLLRVGLLGRRTALLQHNFTPPPPEAEDKKPSLELATICSCSARVVTGSSCPNCAKPRAPPVCSVCRLHVKGLSTTCTVCTHTSHIKCLRQILTNPSSTCPACSCCCLAEQGVSGSFLSTRLQPHSTTTLSSKGFSPETTFAPALGLIDRPEGLLSRARRDLGWTG